MSQEDTNPTASPDGMDPTALPVGSRGWLPVAPDNVVVDVVEFDPIGGTGATFNFGNFTYTAPCCFRCRVNKRVTTIASLLLGMGITSYTVYKIVAVIYGA
jgi:hypothetical protein